MPTAIAFCLGIRVTLEPLANRHFPSLLYLVGHPPHHSMDDLFSTVDDQKHGKISDSVDAVTVWSDLFGVYRPLF